MKATLLFVCFVLFIVVCEIGFGDARQRGENKKKAAKMCSGVFHRSGRRPTDVNCTLYDVDVNTDLDDIYNGRHEDVFREWIELIQAMTRREMESEDDEEELADQDDQDDDDEDELTIMCERKLCFARKLRRHLETNAVPDFCQVEGRSAEDWKQMKKAERPERTPGQPAPPMTVERYTTIFCARVHNPVRPSKNDKNKGQGRSSTGKKRKGGKGRAKGKKAGRRGARTEGARDVERGEAESRNRRSYKKE